jgi:hypothetical protein
MTIDLMKMDDQTIEKKYNFLSKDIDQEKLSRFFSDSEIV